MIIFQKRIKARVFNVFFFSIVSLLSIFLVILQTPDKFGN
ncbi:hypothetical protein CU026_2106 [Enterococcus faecium]|nr:hypothetical protein [Enterococcus faecium]MBK4815296.1 hypothetical protein [Enterococcus faecium]MBK4841347.1 hypothetical protein [Enterococcus faecium]MBK4852323.1 hypothetical protein [Enterococcus faecium]MBK4873564.1 hypothetical protein [Enterococcus faecium]